MKTSLFIFCATTLAAPTLVLSATDQPPIIALFEAKCAGCHHEKKKPELSASISLNELRANTKYVLAGDAENSPLYQSVNLPTDDEDRMPKSTAKKPLDPLTAEEKAVIKEWINGPATGPVATRTFINEEAVDAVVLKDILSQPEGKRRNLRYLTLTKQYNEKDSKGSPLHSDELMDAYRAGVSKMLNSVSSNPQIVNPQPIDDAKTVLRFNLADYNLSESIWTRIAAQYPYDIHTSNDAATKARDALGVLPRMRGDFFVFAISQAPFYYEALGVPGGALQPAADVELEKKLGIMYDKVIMEEGAVRGGFQQSGVSQGNRMIERLPRPDGDYYWKSYDFDPTRVNEQGGNLFKAPLGPVNSNLTKKRELKFSHDGGELFWSLPNGLQGYSLTDAVGTRLDIAPLNVVTDSKREDKKIFAGISCIGCHSQGTFGGAFKDEVANLFASLQLTGEESTHLTRLYDQPKLTALLAQDSARFMEANKKCGVTGTDEPVLQLYNLFKGTLFAGALCAELGQDIPDVLTHLNASPDAEVKNIASRLETSAPVPRELFQKAFPKLVETLGIGKVRARDATSLVDFTPEDILRDGNAVGLRKANTGPVRRLDNSEKELVRPPGMKVVPSATAENRPGPAIRKIGLDPNGAPLPTQPGVGTPSAPSTTLPPATGSAMQPNGTKPKKIGLPVPAGTPAPSGEAPAVEPTAPENPPPAETTQPPQPKIKKIGL